MNNLTLKYDYLNQRQLKQLFLKISQFPFLQKLDLISLNIFFFHIKTILTFVAYSKIIYLLQLTIRHMNEHKKALTEGIHEITLQHVQEIKHIMAHAFLQKNEIWSSFKLQKEQILQFFDRLIRDHLASQQRSKSLYGPQICHSMIFVENGKINSFILHYQLHDYHAIQQQAPLECPEIFLSLEKEGKELMKNVNIAQYPPGQALYANFGGQNPSIQVAGIMKAITFIMYHIRLKQSGFKWIVGRVSNSRAMTIYKKIGARVIKEVTFERDGKHFPLFFFDLDLHGDHFNFCQASLPQLIELHKQNRAPIEPKL